MHVVRLKIHALIIVKPLRCPQTIMDVAHLHRCKPTQKPIVRPLRGRVHGPEPHDLPIFKHCRVQLLP